MAFFKQHRESPLVVCFDADDTLWVNEPNFRKGETAFCEAVAEYATQSQAHEVLYRYIRNNIAVYGYGVKSFALTMVEAAASLTPSLPSSVLQKLLDIGKEMLSMPIELLPGIESVLAELQPEFRLIVATKGDLLDQERKLERSGLSRYFHHIEVMSEKDEASYRKLLSHLDVDPAHFVMVGNSLKSDILPVIGIGGFAVHIPFEITWVLEHVQPERIPASVIRVESHKEIPLALRKIAASLTA